MRCMAYFKSGKEMIAAYNAIVGNKNFSKVLEIKNNINNTDAPVKNVMIIVLFKGIACEF